MSTVKTFSAICANPLAQSIQRARWALPAESLARRDAVLDFWFGEGKWRPLDPPAPETQEIPENFDCLVCGWSRSRRGDRRQVQARR